ncbi:MAG TPA: 4-hydroxy-3-methylbut-2-enyl diphosphate reductase, partial [Bacteroidales bacterium]|nr:4-hydroxy-3-methylbut-2-enyl diphosphate reductase [Bacteroidales bacterium]
MSKLNLKVEIDEKAGFCFGVVKAIEKAEELLDKNNEIYCLGEIVHSDEEIKRLTNKGLKIINYDEFKTLKNKKILFRAHSEPPESYEIAKKNNVEIIDASCPIIQRIKADIKKSFENNENIYIWGKPNHSEIIAINGEINNRAIVFENLNDITL